MDYYTVGVTFSGKDELSAKFYEMLSAANKFSNTTSSAMGRASKSVSAFGSTFKALAYFGVFQRATGLIARGLRETVGAWIDFDKSIRIASAKFKDINQSTAEGQVLMKNLGEAAKQVGIKTQFSTAEAGEGFAAMARAGFTSKQAIDAMTPIVNFATVGQIGLGDASEKAADMLGAMNLKVDDSVQLQQNMTRMTNSLAYALTHANIKAEDFYESVVSGGSTLTAAGNDIETFTALVDALGRHSIKGEMAGTGLKTIMTHIYTAQKQMMSGKSGEQAKVWKGLGIDLIDEKTKQVRNFVDIMDDLIKKSDVKGGGIQNVLFGTAFGAKGINIANAFKLEGMDKVRASIQDMYNDPERGAKMAAKMLESISVKLKILETSLMVKVFKVLDNFKGQSVDFLDSMTTAINNFDMSGLIDAANNAATGFGRVYDEIQMIMGLKGPFSEFSKTIFSELLRNMDILIGLLILSRVQGVKTFVMLAADLGIANAATVIFNGTLVGLSTTLWGIAVANPFGVFLVALGSIAIATREIYDNWDTLSAPGFWSDLGGWIMSGVGAVLDWITEKALALSIIFMKLISHVPAWGIKSSEISSLQAMHDAISNKGHMLPGGAPNSYGETAPTEPGIPFLGPIKSTVTVNVTGLPAGMTATAAVDTSSGNNSAKPIDRSRAGAQ